MANKKISQFEQELILDGSEVLPIVKEGITKKVSITQIVDKVDSYTKSESDDLFDTKVDKVTGSSLVEDTKVTSYDNHLVNSSNPHGVTASQVGAYSTSETDTLLGGKVSTLDVKDNLTSEDTDKPLSANQGKVLQDGKANNNNPQFDGDLELLTSDGGIIFKSIGGIRYRLTVDDNGNLETEAL